MGITVHNLDAHQFVLVGAHLIGVRSDWLSYCPMGEWDPIGVGIGQSLVVYGPFLTEEVAGHYWAANPSLQILDTKPIVSAYNGNDDWLRYGSPLSGISVLSNILAGRQSLSIPSKERNCIHWRVRGDLSLTDANLTPFLEQSTFRGYLGWNASNVVNSITTECWGGGGWRDSFTTGTDGQRRVWDTLRATNTNGVVTYTSVPRPWADRPFATWHTASQLVSDVKNGLRWAVDDVTPIRVRRSPTGILGLTDVRMSSFSGGYVSESRFELDYTFTIRWSSDQTDWFSTVFRTTLVHEFLGFTPDYSHLPIGVTDVDVKSRGNFRETWNTTVQSCSDPARGVGIWGSAIFASGGVTTTRSENITTLLASDTSALTETGDIPSRIESARQILKPGSFHYACDLLRGDIRLSAFQSTSDALVQLESGLDTNLIEQISQLSELPDYLPRLVEAVRLVKSLAKLDVVGSIRDLLDLVTSLRLRYSYAYAPDFDFLETELPRIGGLVERLLLNGPVTRIARGKFTWVFPEGTFGVPFSRLETRTKLVVPNEISPAILSAMGIRSLGLSPTPGNFWDLVPFSFVVDWFFDIGRRIREAENIALLSLTSPSYLCHTFRIVAPIPDEVMETVPLVAMSESNPDVYRPEWIWFLREISRTVPPPRTGRFDFDLPGRPPNLANMGSLLWQLFGLKDP